MARYELIGSGDGHVLAAVPSVTAALGGDAQSTFGDLKAGYWKKSVGSFLGAALHNASPIEIKAVEEIDPREGEVHLESVTSALYSVLHCKPTNGGNQNCLYEEDVFDDLGTKTPLILIHGWQYEGSPVPPPNNLVYWQNFLSYFNDPNTRLIKEKYKVYFFSYYSNDVSVYTLSGILTELLDRQNRVDPSFGNKPIVIVAYSMGGLVARSFMQQRQQTAGKFTGQLGGVRVDKLITLGTPHHGAPSANNPNSISFILYPASSIFSAEWLTLDDSAHLIKGVPRYNQVNRSDLRWDNYDGMLNFTPSSDVQNPWLAQLNSAKTFDNKIVAYAGGYAPSVSGILQCGLDFICLSSALLGALDMAGDGIVPVKSAQFEGYKVSSGPMRFFSDYDHFQI